MRSIEARIEDVRRWLAAARRLQGAGPEVIDRICDTTGLSREGVRLALAEHLEVDPAGSDLERFVASAGDTPSVAVILSANVFVGALRAIALARAAAESVVVRPSHRDPVFAELLVAEARDPAVTLDPDLDIASIEGGEIHVYGRDETIDEIRRQARPSVLRVRGHGAGFGIAWVSGNAAIDQAAQGLARDVIVFDQRGCLSPRLAFVEGDEARALAFAAALDANLTFFAETVPRGTLDPAEAAESTRWVATMTYAGRIFRSAHHAVAVAPEGLLLDLPPVGRHVRVVAARDVGAAAAALAPFARSVTTVGSDDLGSIRHLAPPGIRVAYLGTMQRPPLDGPVDGRV